MVWKEPTDTDPGTAAVVGAPDIKKMAQLLNGVTNIDNVTIDSPIEIQNSKLTVSSITNSGTITFPSSTTTLVGNNTTDTLTNKTLTAPVIATITNSGTVTVPATTDTLVGKATTDTLTNKTLSGVTIANATDITISDTTGTKIGQAISKIGFFGATPIVQPAANADTSGAVLADLETEVNQIKQLLRNLGLLAT